jgi:hypothetical protein
MLVLTSPTKRPLPATLVPVVLLLGLIGWAAPASAHAPSKPRYAVSVAPTSTVAGSTGNTLVFTFSSLRSGSSKVSVRIPSNAGWTAPQNRHRARPGYVSAARGSCKSAKVASVRGGRTVTVSANCKKGNSFTLTYAGADAPTLAGPYTFVTRTDASDRRVPLSPQPVVTVDPGPTSQLAVTGLANAVAGTSQSPTVTARDAYGNSTPNYRGTVHFTGTGDAPAFSFGDSGWEVPADYAFTAGDAGTHTFAATAKTAGAQTLTAADTQTNTITGSQTITIGPGPTTLLTATFSGFPGAAIPGQTLRVGIVVTAGDGHGNVATGDNGFMNVAVTQEGTDCDGCLELLGAFLESGRQTFSVDVAVVSTRIQVSIEARRPGVRGLSSIFFTVGRAPNLDTAKLDWDPSTSNPDGTHDGSLELKDPNAPAAVQVDPNSLVVSGSPVVNGDGTTTIPITAITLGGLTISAPIVVTTPTDATTGEFVNQTYSQGTQLQVVGCDSLAQSFAAVGTPPPGVPAPPPCPNATWSPVTVNSATPFIKTTDGTSPISVVVGAYCNSDGKCGLQP